MGRKSLAFWHRYRHYFRAVTICRKRRLCFGRGELYLTVGRAFEIIKEIRWDGTAILLVEQNAGKSLAISDRAYVPENGRIVLFGTGAELSAGEMVQKAYSGG